MATVRSDPSSSSGGTNDVESEVKLFTVLKDDEEEFDDSKPSTTPAPHVLPASDMAEGAEVSP